MAGAVEELLEKLQADPACAATAVPKALAGKAREEIRHALLNDRRFGPPLQAAIADLEVATETKWLVQFLGWLKFRPAVPELLALWRARVDGLSYQAAQALLLIGDAAAIAAVAKDFPDVVGIDAAVAFDCVLAGDPASVHDALAPVLSELGDKTAEVLSHVAGREEVFAADPRWRELAVRAFREGTGSVRDAARELLLRRVPGRELARLFPHEAAAPVDEDAMERELARARRTMTKLRDALPTSVWTAPPKARPKQIARLEETIGPLPAAVRAFYEVIDGIDVPAPKPRDRFVVYPLAEAVKELRRWTRTASPKTTPAALLPPFHFPVAPDGYTKAGLSGGPAIGIELPTADPDPVLLHVARAPRFTTFVRRASRRAKKR